MSEELTNLWTAPGSPGFSVYGKLPTKAIAQLILNGFALAGTAGNKAPAGLAGLKQAP